MLFPIRTINDQRGFQNLIRIKSCSRDSHHKSLIAVIDDIIISSTNSFTEMRVILGVARLRLSKTILDTCRLKAGTAQTNCLSDVFFL